MTRKRASIRVLRGNETDPPARNCLAFAEKAFHRAGKCYRLSKRNPRFDVPSRKLTVGRKKGPREREERRVLEALYLIAQSGRMHHEETRVTLVNARGGRRLAVSRGAEGGRGNVREKKKTRKTSRG